MEESEHDDRVEAMSGPFHVGTWENIIEAQFFLHPARDHHSAHALDEIDDERQSCLPGKLRSGVGAAWADTAPEQGMPDEEWKTKAAVKGG